MARRSHITGSTIDGQYDAGVPPGAGSRESGWA
jgi:hypothetical protein